jgi:mRNA interferase HicA
VKNGVLLQELRKIAKAKDLTLRLLRHGANHDLYELGSVRLTVPRHTEINEITAKGIIREANKA